MSSLQTYLNKKICVILTDGRTLVGTLFSCDNSTNIVLSSTIERVIRPADDEEESEERELGVSLIRGDTVVLCGLVDEEMDKSIDWEKVRGDGIGGTKHV